MVYNNSVGNIVNQVRVNNAGSLVNSQAVGVNTQHSTNATGTESSSAISGNISRFTTASGNAQGFYTDGTVQNGFVINVNGMALQAFDGVTDNSSVEVNPDKVTINAKQEFFLNEGTTAAGGGTGTATNGMVIKLLDDTTGQAQWAPESNLQNTALFVQALQNTTQWTPGEAPSVKNTIYDTTITASPSFTLLAGGVIRCDVGGTFRIEADVNMIGFSGGSPGTVIIANVLINGAPQTAGGIMSFYANGYPDAVHLTTDVTLSALDTVEVALAKIGGQPGVTNLQNINRVSLTQIA